MKTSTLLTAGLLATAAVAAPLTEKRAAAKAARLARRGENRKSNPPLKPGTNEAINLTGAKDTEYSSNWAGAVLVGTGYTAVTAEFTVPTPSVPSGGSSREQYCASAWVGIDGDTCDTAILQTGVDFCIEGSTVSYDAWYEWYPDYAYDFSGISISAGDVIKVTVDATSKTAGTATVENVTKGTTVTHTFSGGVDGDLCEYNAEWIVEDFEEDDSLVPFADFGTVTFSSASATKSGSSVGPSGATIIDIEQNNEVLTSVSTSSSEVVVTYV
ncbi:A4/G1 family peptidase [Aspergillus saccharolyticus JOP 1030-1]|uniref:Putative aspergillopepsin n=1 Tax=Aspergillus saccharolyticus JOP 1030-1 TaxID=1450539 RepID=A0A318ZJZ1_9EURO|nr:putative aspergillopepsin [Aspergillus saccharolyticus JOP 1030-1]PYH47115.1 putative aspergillopepsin [Aspergillus saccharolyticus JOP 1030-1]